MLKAKLKTLLIRFFPFLLTIFVATAASGSSNFYADAYAE